MTSQTEKILDSTIKNMDDNEKYNAIWKLISELTKYNKMTYRDLNLFFKGKLQTK